MLFKVDGTETHFIGAVHMLRTNAEHLPQKYWDVYEQAERVVFESDFDARYLPANAKFIAPLGLRQVIPPALFDATSALWREFQLPQLDACKPWFAAMCLENAIPQRASFGTNGVDKQMWDRTRPEKRSVLESGNTLQFFDDVPIEEQNSYLAYMVSDPNEVVKQIRKVVAAWRNEDLVTLEDFLSLSVKAFPSIMRGLIDERNRKWLPSILKIVNEGKRAVFVLGAMHFAGDAKIQGLMKDHGYDLIKV